jgi:hypothetical protein
VSRCSARRPHRPEHTMAARNTRPKAGDPVVEGFVHNRLRRRRTGRHLRDGGGRHPAALLRGLCGVSLWRRCSTGRSPSRRRPDVVRCSRRGHRRRGWPDGRLVCVRRRGLLLRRVELGGSTTSKHPEHPVGRSAVKQPAPCQVARHVARRLDSLPDTTRAPGPGR